MGIRINSGVVMDEHAGLMKQVWEKILPEDLQAKMYITSAFRSGDWNPSAGSFHGALDDMGAMDIAAGMTTEGQRAMQAAARRLEPYYQYFRQVIHSTPFADDNGFYVAFGKYNSGAYSQTVKNQHLNHIHTSASVHDLRRLLSSLSSTTPSSTTVSSLPDDGDGIVYGWDASDFDWGRGARPAHVYNAAAEGIQFFTHKVTEGTRTVHTHAGEMVRAAVAARIPLYGFYVVPRTPGNNGHGSISAQVDYAIYHANQQMPEWRTLPGFFWQIDTEEWGYDDVAPQYGAEMCDLFIQRTGKRVAHYAPKWAYGNTIPGNHPLWASSYGSNPVAGFKQAYAMAGGNNHVGWTAYSGRVPTILQYGAKCIIGGQGTCDANAFRGSVSQMAQIFAPGAEGVYQQKGSEMIFVKAADSEVVYKTNGLQNAPITGVGAESAFNKAKAAGVPFVEVANHEEFLQLCGVPFSEGPPVNVDVNALAAAIVAALTAAGIDPLSVDETRAAVEAGVRQVLGSLDN